MSSRVLTRWDPEDKEFWEKEGKGIATRNLWISIPALFFAFSVWMVWSVVVVNLQLIGFTYDPNKLFWLAALPGLSGATLRIFYSFMVPIFGGRKWTTISTASLLIPAIGIGFAVRDPETSYTTMLVLALLCGLGGGNFASSMANISFFFPKARKGTALGLNAGLGNLGVSAMQFLVPLVISTGMFSALCGGPQICIIDGVPRPMWLQNAGFIWVPFILASTIEAWFGMNDIASAKASFREQAVIFHRMHNWLMCWLYLGTFGSFIGYSAALPLLIKGQFPGVNPVKYAFLGPLVGALMRPVGGWVSDKLGGARVTFWNFIVMAASVIGILYFLPHPGEDDLFGSFFHGDHHDHHDHHHEEENFWGFLAMFIVLFVATGIGNGSIFRMIPVIFLTWHQRAAQGKGPQAQEQAQRDGGKEAAAVLGFTSAIAAYGAFFIPKSFGTSITFTGGPQAALYGFIAFYMSCIVITWWFYSRRNAAMPC